MTFSCSNLSICFLSRNELFYKVVFFVKLTITCHFKVCIQGFPKWSTTAIEVTSGLLSLKLSFPDNTITCQTV